MRLRLQDVTREIGDRVGMCQTDQRLIDYINSAQESLLYAGKFVNTLLRYEVQCNAGYITFPRQIETIEGITVNGCGRIIRNGWYEYRDYGRGQITEQNGNCLRALTDRGEVCSAFDITGDNKKIKVYADVAEAGSAKILLQGYDENNNWIRTNVGGVWVEGEYVDLINGTPQLSTKIFKQLTGVQKPQTNGMIRIYQFNPDDSTQSLLSMYEWDEEVPIYRRALLTSVRDNSTVDVYAKARMIPAKDPKDYLIIQNRNGLRDMVYAKFMLDNNDPKSAANYEQFAMKEMRNQLNHYQGSGQIRFVKFQNPSTFGGGKTKTLI